MVLDFNGTLRAEWHGSIGKLGNLFAIMDGEKILHRGSFGYIAVKWKKLTGQILTH